MMEAHAFPYCKRIREPVLTDLELFREHGTGLKLAVHREQGFVDVIEDVGRNSPARHMRIERRRFADMRNAKYPTAAWRLLCGCKRREAQNQS